MAILWQRCVNDKTYEVRNAGASLRLYTNGAFHSQYNPRHLMTHAVWDLLTLPTLFPETPPRHVLMLGVGGGTAVHQLNNLVAPDEIVGIELDPVHIEVARRFFKATGPNVKLVQADALVWLKHSKRKFDVIIDDIFVDAIGDPVRPAPIDGPWLKRLAARTSASGMVIQNHLSPRSVRGMIARHADTIHAHFKSGLLFTTPQYENGIIAFYKTRIDAKAGRAHAHSIIAAIDPATARKLKFTCRQLF